MILDYPNGSSVITEVLVRKRQAVQRWRELRMLASTLLALGMVKGPRAEECGQGPEAGKSRGTDLPLELQKERCPAKAFLVALLPVDSFDF